ncbi:hypothetical protein N0O92_22010 [Alkalihalobacillus sp. MEB130]|uniref:hypothetical protein n=1 Tax=Alkalihalobacillus sp. MEB130 TaxID=2976704 RepID=UPI0028DE726F|nr:hypothetical protein [Alkalihalobacillus sp. MEB130]MDT8862852.1 hypothetical protein [Alkalihalobacillus sp. MEB130]
MDIFIGILCLFSLCMIILILTSLILTNTKEIDPCRKKDPYRYLFHDHIFDEK